MKLHTIGLSVIMLAMLVIAAGCSSATPTVAPVQPVNTQPAAQPGNTSVPPAATGTSLPPTATDTSMPPAKTVPASAPAVDAQALLQQNCTRCHGIDRVTNSRHTAQEWQSIVERMVRKGAKLSTEEVFIVVDYLAATYPK